jgi:hypothetical protein
MGFGRRKRREKKKEKKARGVEMKVKGRKVAARIKRSTRDNGASGASYDGVLIT